MPDEFEPYVVCVDQPDVVIPVEATVEAGLISEAVPGPLADGSGVGTPKVVKFVPPALGIGGRRLSALIDACYPAASRRVGEEGRVLLRITIGADGKPLARQVTGSSGFPRLDDQAIGCVVDSIVFVAAARDGQAVEADAMLPIVFRLH